MFCLAQHLNLTSIYKNKIIEFECIRAKIRNIYDSDGTEKLSGVVNKKITKFKFFSKSCQVYIMIEVSQDMFDFDSDGFMNYEKALYFLRSYFERCKFEASTQEVNIAFYARLYYPQAHSKDSFMKFARETL